MKNLIKNLFLPLAVFAMLGLGALTLSASNVTNDVVTENMEVAENLAQTPYLGDIYYLDAVTGYTIASGVTENHCSLDEGEDLCFRDVPGVGMVQLYGETSPGVYKKLYELD